MFFSRKGRSEPGVAHMVFEAILGVVLGAAIAAAWLMLKPVAISDAPKEPEAGVVPERHTVAYINGREGPVRQGPWQAKRKAFLAGSERGVELLEQDLNRWFAVQYADLERTKKWESFGVEYRGGFPVFRFDGSEVEVGLVNELAMSKDWERKLVVQAKGAFEARGDRFVFVPHTMFVGSCPIPFAGVRQKVMSWVTEPFVLPEEEAKAWNAIRDVRVEQSRLKVGFRPPPPPVAPTIEVNRPAEATVPPAEAAEVVATDDTAIADTSDQPTAATETPPATETAAPVPVPAAETPTEGETAAPSPAEPPPAETTPPGA